MPATLAGGGSFRPVLGVDGCPAGWFCVGLAPPPGCAADGPLSCSWALRPDLDAVLAAEPEALIVIDVPIGLGDGPPRPCDAAARRLLGPRRSSVFTPPMRGMLTQPTRVAATAYGQARRAGGGLSAQAWNIVPKIREADRVVTPRLQARVREGHPEVAFARLHGAPLPEAKRTPGGAAHRRALLTAAGIEAEGLLGAVRAVHPRRLVADDDVLDAAVLALSAVAVQAGTATRLGGERDGTGRIMEIVA